jgi:hypothetical protein
LGERLEHTHIERLKRMRGMRREDGQEDLVLVTVLYKIHDNVRSMAVKDQ